MHLHQQHALGQAPSENVKGQQNDPAPFVDLCSLITPDQHIVGFLLTTIRDVEFSGDYDF
jgi:hypothetical protein